jgi:hypothetical protein
MALIGPLDEESQRARAHDVMTDALTRINARTEPPAAPTETGPLPGHPTTGRDDLEAAASWRRSSPAAHRASENAMTKVVLATEDLAATHVAFVRFGPPTGRTEAAALITSTQQDLETLTAQHALLAHAQRPRGRRGSRRRSRAHRRTGPRPGPAETGTTRRCAAALPADRRQRSPGGRTETRGCVAAAPGQPGPESAHTACCGSSQPNRAARGGSARLQGRPGGADRRPIPPANPPARQHRAAQNHSRQPGPAPAPAARAALRPRPPPALNGTDSFVDEAGHPEMPARG